MTRLVQQNISSNKVYFLGKKGLQATKRVSVGDSITICLHANSTVIKNKLIAQKGGMISIDVLRKTNQLYDNSFIVNYDGVEKDLTRTYGEWHLRNK